MRMQITTKIFLVMGLCLCFITAQALENNYYIEVCFIPLKDIVRSEGQIFVGNIRHVFVRGNDGTGLMGLNFEPENWWGFLGGRARVGKQNYAEARCENIFSTDSKDEYKKEWEKFVEGYEEYAQLKRYNIGFMNCQHVTKAVLKNLGYKIPQSIEKELDF